MVLITSPTLNQVFSLATKVVQIVFGRLFLFSLFFAADVFVPHVSLFFVVYFFAVVLCSL